MKTTHRCPKCGHGRILYIAQVADHSGSHGTRAEPARIARIESPGGDLFGMKLTNVASAGELEAGVCRRCGYTEFYVKDPGAIPIDGTNVRELAATGG